MRVKFKDYEDNTTRVVEVCDVGTTYDYDDQPSRLYLVGSRTYFVCKQELSGSEISGILDSLFEHGHYDFGDLKFEEDHNAL